MGVTQAEAGRVCVCVCVSVCVCNTHQLDWLWEGGQGWIERSQAVEGHKRLDVQKPMFLSRGDRDLGVILERRPQCAVSHEVRRRGQ